MSHNIVTFLSLDILLVEGIHDMGQHLWRNNISQ